jgi:XRE family transcriptional regulator, fatty acid utilization regulator
MADVRPLYLGPRLRRLRRELGLTQQAMSDDLGISASYVALLERNQRPVTADMLLRLAKTYGLDIQDIASDAGDEYAKRITELLRNPIFAGIDLPPLEISDLAMSFPGVSEALLRLHGAYEREHRALAEMRVSGSAPEDHDPVVEVERFLARNRNYFDSIDALAEALASEIAGEGGAKQWLAAKGVRVRFLPPDVMLDSLRRFDRHNQQLLIVDSLDAASRSFQLAAHIVHSSLRATINEIVRGESFASKTAETLAKRALAANGAAALVMPYARFARAAEDRHYDIVALGRVFGASFEQVAHRLTTLNRAGHEGVPFFFLRVDEAGNVSKRLDGASFPFAPHGGGCPLWNVHAAFRSPGQIVTQWLELPDGARFFSVARTVVSGGGGFDRPGATRAVALACVADEAHRLVYAGPAPDERDFTPIGVTCRLCNRAECVARSAPPIGREILPDDTRRPLQPYAFAET